MKHEADIAELARLYTKEHLTGRQIAAIVGMSNRTVLRWLHKAGVSVRNAGSPIIDKCVDRDWLAEQYVSLGKSTTQVTLCLPCHEMAHGHGFKFRFKARQKPTSASISSN